VLAVGRGSGCGSVRPPGGLVVAAGVEGQGAEELAGGGAHDPDVQVLDEQDDVGSGVGPADADVVELAGVAEGDAAGVVDDVAADPVVGVGVAAAGGGFGPRGVGGRGGGPVRQGAVRPGGVVVAGERVEEGLQVRPGGGLGGQPVLQGLPEPLDLAVGLRVVRAAVLLGDAQPTQLGLEAVAAPRPPEYRVV
jgi:hypothetical protein